LFHMDPVYSIHTAMVTILSRQCEILISLTVRSTPAHVLTHIMPVIHDEA